MKKLLTIVAGIALSYSVATAQQTASVIVRSAEMTNMLGTITGGAKVSQIILTAPANNTATIRFIDSVTNILTYTSGAYATITPYATNLITSYTNFFGTVNSFTNIALVDASNYVAATTYTYPVLVTITAATNSSVLLANQALFFNNAVWATNMGSGIGTVNITYQSR